MFENVKKRQTCFRKPGQNDRSGYCENGETQIDSSNRRIHLGLPNKAISSDYKY